MSLSPAHEDIATARTAVLNQSAATVLDLLRCPRGHQGGRHISGDTLGITQNLLCLGHIRPIEPPDHRASGQILNRFETPVVSPLREQQRHKTFIDQRQNDFPQLRPIISLELLVRQMVVVPLVQRHKRKRARTRHTLLFF